MKNTKRISLGAVSISLLAFSVVLVGSAPASADPGHPGTPHDPSVVFAEDFENLPNNDPVGLASYVGADGTNYTADPSWLDASACNGIILNSLAAEPPVAPLDLCVTAASRANLRSLGEALGVHQGSANPETNRVVSAYTDDNPAPGDELEFRTAPGTPIDFLPVQNRFFTIGADVAAVNCDIASSPLLDFALIDGANEHFVTTAPINVCNDPRTSRVTVNGIDVDLGSIIGDQAFLFTGDELGLAMYNRNASGGGNDHAFDNVQLLDVTPQLDKEFANVPDPLFVGVDEFDLVLTVTNTSELGEKDGWSFTDNLNGLAVGSAGVVENTCDADVVAAPGSNTVSVTNGLLSVGEVSCAVTVSVVATGDGEITNGPGNVDGSGVLSPGLASVTAIAPNPELTLEKLDDLVDDNSNGFAEAGEVINYTFVVTNTGNVTVTDIVVNDDKVTGLTPEGFTLEPGESQTVTADPYVVTETDVEAGGVFNTAQADGLDPWGNGVLSNEASVETPVAFPDLPDTGAMAEAWMAYVALLMIGAGAATLVARRKFVPLETA